MGLRRWIYQKKVSKQFSGQGYVQAPRESSRISDRFHVCTVANRIRLHLHRLVFSCQKTGHDLKILGLGQHYSGHYAKLLWLLEYLHTLDEEEILLFVDAYDVTLLAERRLLLQKFKQFNAPIVMSVEKNCYPFQELQEHYPPSTTPFRFINAGSYMGYVGALKKWLTALQINEKVCDQGQITRHFIANPHFLRLDYTCELFLPLFAVKREEVLIDPARRALFCTTTQTFPALVHANAGKHGGAYPLWDEIYEKVVL